MLSELGAALEVDAKAAAEFDATNPASLQEFFQEIAAPIDHVLVTGPGPRYGPMLEMTADEVRHAVSDHVVLGLDVARNAAGQALCEWVSPILVTRRSTSEQAG